MSEIWQGYSVLIIWIIGSVALFFAFRAWQRFREGRKDDWQRFQRLKYQDVEDLEPAELLYVSKRLIRELGDKYQGILSQDAPLGFDKRTLHRIFLKLDGYDSDEVNALNASAPSAESLDKTDITRARKILRRLSKLMGES